MNLMDMLSADLAVNPISGEEPFYETLANLEQNEQSESSVHYLPCVMSTLQKDMSEAIVQIFSSLLESEIVMRKQRTSINTLLESSSLLKDNEHLILDSLSLMYNQLLTVSMHPSLLVDHFISKGLLLLSPKDRLLDLSGKMKLFNELIDVLTEKQESKSLTSDYNMLVVARSVKELELIEGLIVGKKLFYHNWSSGKLYDEQPASSRTKNDQSGDSPGFDSWRRLRHGNRFATEVEPNPKLVLHLITSSQLYNTYPSGTTLDLIFSFDAGLDLKSPGLDLRRRNNKSSISLLPQREVPLIIPIQIFSIEHIGHILALPNHSFSTTKDEEAWRLKVLKTYIVNRCHLFMPLKKDDLIGNPGKMFHHLGSWLLDWEKVRPPAILNLLEEYSNKLSIDPEDSAVISSVNENHLTSLGSTFMPISGEASNCFTSKDGVPKEPIDYQRLKQELAQFLNKRADEVETLIEDGLNIVLPDLRKVEASRQLEIDSLEDQVGDNYRKLRKLNDTLSSVDKKIIRVESENQNLQTQFHELENLMNHLEDVTKNKTEEEINALIQEQSTIVRDLEAEKERLEEEYRSLAEGSEKAREVYQSQSTKAVKATGKLNSTLAKQKSLEQKLNGPGMRLIPSLTRKDELAMYDRKLRRVEVENKFLNLLFSMRFDRLVKERTSSMEHAASLSVRLNNRSRGSTPFQLS